MKLTNSISIKKMSLIAAVLSAVVNTIIFVLAVAADIFPSLTFQPDLGAQMSIEPVILVSILGALAATGVFALLRTRISRPVPVFLWIAAVVLLLSFVAPFAIPGTELLQAVVLNVMHVVVAAFVVWAVLHTKEAV